MPDDAATVHLDVPAVEESLEDVHAAVAGLWEADPTVGVRDRIRFETALIEIVGNIVEHAYRLDESEPGLVARAATRGGRQIDVTLTVDARQVRAVLGDNGLPAALDLSGVTMPEDDLAESGRGLALALASVDDLDYGRVDGRNTWSLTCVRRPD